MKKKFYLVLGFVGLALGFVGAIVPLLPAFPFLVMAAFGFSRGSEKLHTWFLNTKLYKDNLESFLQGRGMTRAAKLRVILTVTVVMGLGIFFMRRIPWGQALLALIWVGHVVGFVWGVKTVGE
ncbi:MAG: DUF454 domain-containing protein [Clostridiales bacterium]|nr:DUF454 domain-containing protein [Clostridiales bacterium]